MSTPLEIAQTHACETESRIGAVSRALLAHDAALRQIYAKCCEAKPDAYTVGFVMEVAGNALRETGEKS